MKIIKMNEIRTLDFSEISGHIIEAQKYLFDLKLKHATRQQIKTHLFKKYKRMLAQLLTQQNKLMNNKAV